MMMNNYVEEELPLGYRFCPTDQELIQHYLTRKVNGEPLHRLTPIVEKNLYGNDQPSPWEIFRGRKISKTAAKEDNDFYFFTRVQKKFGSGRNMERRIATGTWKIQNNNPVSDDPNPTENKKKKKKKKKMNNKSSGLILGRKKQLNYIEGSEKHKGSLIMHEFSLKEYPKHETENWVICRIRMGKPSDTTTTSCSCNASSSDQNQPSLKRHAVDDDDPDVHLCEPEKKRSKPSLPSVSTLEETAGTYEDVEGLQLQQSQSCSDYIHDDDDYDVHLCESENKRSKPSSPSVSTLEETAATYEDGKDLQLQQSQSCCSDYIHDDDDDALLCSSDFDYGEGLATFDDGFYKASHSQEPELPQLCTNSHGTTSCSMEPRNQSEVSIPIDDVFDLPPLIEESSSQSENQPQLDYQLVLSDYTAQQPSYSFDDIWDDSFIFGDS